MWLPWLPFSPVVMERKLDCYNTTKTQRHKQEKYNNIIVKIEVLQLSRFCGHPENQVWLLVSILLSALTPTPKIEKKG